MSLIKENLPSVAPELINNYIPIIINKRQPLQKRINTVFICGMDYFYFFFLFYNIYQTVEIVLIIIINLFLKIINK